MSTATFAQLCRNLGQSRLQSLAADSSTEALPVVDYPFSWGDCWTGNVGVVVEDLESEIGFWIDIVGFRPFVYFDDTLMFRSPDNSFGMSLTKANENVPPSTSITVELMLDNIKEATEVIQSRGGKLDHALRPVWGEEHTMRTSELTSPAGFRVILWGMSQPSAEEKENVQEGTIAV